MVTDPVAERDAGVMAAALRGRWFHFIPGDLQSEFAKDCDDLSHVVGSERQRGREEMRDRAADYVEHSRETIHQHSDGVPIGDCPRWDNGAEIATAIRSLSTED